jgi:hypothetical protein
MANVNLNSGLERALAVEKTISCLKKCNKKTAAGKAPGEMSTQISRLH